MDSLLRTLFSFVIPENVMSDEDVHEAKTIGFSFIDELLLNIEKNDIFKAKFQ